MSSPSPAVKAISPSPRPRAPPPKPVNTSIQWPGFVSIAFTGLAFIVMAGDWVGPDLTFTVLLAFLTAFDGKIISVSKAAAGYSNTGLLTVIFLYLVAEGVTQTGALELIMNQLLGRSRSVHWALVRSMLPVMFLSTFLNNTPCVAFMIPILMSWGRRCGVPVKKLLIPLSYAAVLGGTCSSIGTSTNLVIVGLQDARYSKLQQAENAKFEIFDIAPYGVPYALWGFIFILLTQRWLLPGNSSRFAKDLLLALRVLPTSGVVKKRLKDSGLLTLHGTSLKAIWRKNTLLREMDPDIVLEGDEILYFAGELDVVEYVGEEYGLGLVSQEGEALLHEEEHPLAETAAAPYSKLIQAVVKKDADIIGRAVKDVQLGSRFGTTLVSIQRGNGREDGRLSDVILAGGDVLILDTGATFNKDSSDFLANFENFNFVKDGAAKEFVIGVKVRKTSDVKGKTVSAAGLRGIPGLFVLNVEHADGSVVPASDYLYKLQPDDTIWFAADIAAVSFLSKFPGLVLVQQEQVDKTSTNILYRQLVQAAVSHKGALVGKTVRDIRFRALYNAAVVAVHREGARVPLKVQDIVLQGGDVLLLSCSTTWGEEHRHDRAFVLIQDVPNSSPPKKSRAIIGALLATGMVLTQIIGGLQKVEYIHLWPAAVLTAFLMLLAGCMSAEQARKSIYWDVYLTIAAAFGVSAALEGTYVALNFANVFISIGKAIGSTGAVLISIYVATALMSEILTNNAAAAIMYPIAAIAGDKSGISSRDTSVAIMLGASAGFVNPFSYQTNLMVYSAGNYKTREFARVGAPFQLWLMVVAGFILIYRDSWHQVWIVTWVVTAAVIFFPALWLLTPASFQLAVANACARLVKRLDPRGARAQQRSISNASTSSTTELPTISVSKGVAID